MKKTITIFLLFMLTFSSVIMAQPPDAVYYYKEVGKKIKVKSWYAAGDSYGFPEIEKKFPDLSISCGLPHNLSDNKSELTVNLNIYVTGSSAAPYFFSIENLSVREQEKKHPIYPQHQVSEFAQEALANMGNEVSRRLFQNESKEGMIVSKYEVPVTRNDSYSNTFLLKNVSPFPKRLYLDYKFRIRKEGGPEEVFEGTIPMELAQYHVSWWEKVNY